MTEQKIVVVDGRKFEAVPQPSGECNGCHAMGDRELCYVLPKCSGLASDDWVPRIFVELKEEQKSPASEAPVKPNMLVVHHGFGEISLRMEELLAQGYKLLSYDFSRQEALLVLDEDVVHPQFSVKGV